jgi:hypothetical protein
MLTVTSLRDLPSLPYINAEGRLPQDYGQKIGAYAIFDQQHSLAHLGFSRNVLLSLKQNLIRNPSACHWVKIATIERPSKRDLEAILAHWQEESGGSPYSERNPEERWIQSINLHELMTDEEKAAYADPALNERGRVKALKQTSHRLEADILLQLKARGCQEELRFNPKLKETGILDIKE